MPIILVICFISYTVLSWVMLFRDSWAVEVLRTKFYPGQTDLINGLQTSLSNFKLNTVPTFLFLVIIIVAFLAYFSSWRRQLTTKKIVLLSLLFQIVVFFSYPILSKDIFYYIFSDRVATVYHQNVWQVKSGEFSQDPYYFLIYPIYKTTDWYSRQTKIYGPVNQAIYSAVTAVSGNDLLVNLAAHKFVVLGFNLASMLLVYKILKKYFPDRLNFSLIFLFWNPLFILETVGSGHNDSIMFFFILLSYLFFLAKRPLFVALSLALALGVKSTALLLAPIYVVSLFRHHWSRALKFLLAFALFSLIIFLTMGTTWISFINRTVLSINLYWQSFPQQLAKIFPPAVQLITPIFLLGYFLICLRALMVKKDPLVLYGQIFLVYLLFVLGAYWNWYSLWVLTSFAFLPSGRLTRIAAAYTFTSALAYAVYWLSLRFDFQHPAWSFVIYLVLLSGPLGVFIYDRFFQKISL